MADSTPSARLGKPAKPYPDFPLTPHPSGRWCKKIRGKLWYFGPWADPDAALKKHLEQRDDLRAGRKPRVEGDGFTVKNLAGNFLNHKRQLRDNGELAPRRWDDYSQTCAKIVEVFGRDRLVADLSTEEFETFRGKLAKSRGPVTLGNEIQRVRVVFKYAYDAGHLAAPLRYGALLAGEVDGRFAGEQGNRQAAPRGGHSQVQRRPRRVGLLCASSHFRDHRRRVTRPSGRRFCSGPPE